MWKRKLALAMISNCGLSIEQQLELIKKTGFDGFFPCWSAELDLDAMMRKANEVGLQLQSIHAPWGRAADMWRDNEEKGKAAVEELKRCVDACAKCGTSILVVHAFIGFEEHEPTQTGLRRFGEVADYAQKNGVRIALENTEGEEYLAALLEYFRGNDTVGFCWDSGHEMCYNHSQDLLARYGDRLLATHLNDNLGIRDYDGKITWIDDLHLLPFDGIADWQNIAKRLNDSRQTGMLTFELNITSKPDRHENDPYGMMPFELYLSEAYKRACRVATLIEREKDNLV